MRGTAWQCAKIGSSTTSGPWQAVGRVRYSRQNPTVFPAVRGVIGLSGRVHGNKRKLREHTFTASEIYAEGRGGGAGRLHLAGIANLQNLFERLFKLWPGRLQV